MTDLNKYYQLAELVAAYVADEQKVMPAELSAWLDENVENRLLFERLVEDEKLKTSVERYERIDVGAAWETVNERLFIEKSKTKGGYLWVKIAIAASLLLVAAAGFWFYNSYNPDRKQPDISIVGTTKIVPGKNAATLTLADGRKIVLSDASNGELAKEGGVSIHKTKDGTVVYKVEDLALKGSNSGVLFNVINTARGEQYQISLPDGTKVWLNAASSLKYPSSFNSFKDRKVELTGEAYFEVAHNVNKPFSVQINSQVVKVLGTHFNIKSYASDGMSRTTLLEGSVQIRQTGVSNSLTLKPGQELSLNNMNGHMEVGKANIESVMAWKNGYFYFQNENIRTIMQDISRWYDVDVDYEGIITNAGYDGSISRFKSITEVLEILELTGGIHFKINGRRVTVM